MFVAGTAGFVGLQEPALSESESTNWKKIKKQFPDSSSPVLNLNNGSAGMIPKVVESQLAKLLSIMNTMAPYEALGVWNSINAKARRLLAEMIGAKTEEIAIVRNTTEALNYVFKGIDIPENSTVICAKHDYGHAINILQRLAAEKKFNLKYVELNLPATKDQIINAYKEHVDENCSMVLLTAMTHREGQILPIKALTKLCKKHGALVVVDAAHAIGQLEHSVTDWDCDYYCTSLHKWLGCPIGSGLLYMKQDLISSTRGSYSADKKIDDRMSKFEDVGTKPFAIEASILSGLNFHNAIGLSAKNKRLKTLSDYWIKGVQEIPDFSCFKAEEYAGIASFNYPRPSDEMMDHLEANKIHVKKIFARYYPKESQSRFRVSPNIYHDFNDLDRLIDALKSFTN